MQKCIILNSILLCPVSLTPQRLCDIRVRLGYIATASCKTSPPLICSVPLYSLTVIVHNVILWLPTALVFHINQSYQSMEGTSTFFCMYNWCLVSIAWRHFKWIETQIFPPQHVRASFCQLSNNAATEEFFIMPLTEKQSWTLKLR